MAAITSTGNVINVIADHVDGALPAGIPSVLRLPTRSATIIIGGRRWRSFDKRYLQCETNGLTFHCSG